MLTRTVRLKSDISQNVTKQLFSWLLKKKRKFCTSRSENLYQNESNDEYSEHDRVDRRHDDYGSRFGQRYGGGYGQKYGRKFGSFNHRRDFRRQGGFSSRDLVFEPDINWDSVELKPFKKDFYTPHPNVLSRSPEEVQEFYRKNDIKIFGQNCPVPIFDFNELDLTEEVLNYLRLCKYAEPTPIQSQTWPIALSGRDMVGISRTGSGKTLGYVLPALVHIKNQPPLEKNEGPIALVLAPTRELVQQIQSVTHLIAGACGMKTACLFGGSSRVRQMNEVLRKNEVYIATPGRLLDFLKDQVTDLKRCTYLVLDEADQMLDMGFEGQIRSIIDHIRPDRQVLMWSATWPKEIRNLANEFLKNYIKVQVGSAELSANPNIKQIIHVCNEDDKLTLLKEIMSQILKEQDNKTLIFSQTKYGVEKICRYLLNEGISAKTLHGDHSQNSRDRVMSYFREGRCRVLVATNVAGRGIDVKDIRYVINFDFPNTVEEYVHKIGRTARSEDSGTAHTFFTVENAALAQDLISVLETSNQPVSIELKELAERRLHRLSNPRANKFGYSRRY